MVRVLVTPITPDNKFFTLMFSEVDRSTLFDEVGKHPEYITLPVYGTIVHELTVQGRTLYMCVVGRNVTTPPECQNLPQGPNTAYKSINIPLYAKDDVTDLLQDAQLEFYASGDVSIRVGTNKLYPLIQDIPVETPDGIVLVGYDKLSVTNILDDNGNPVTENVMWKIFIGFRRVYGNEYSAFLLNAATVEVDGQGTGDVQIGVSYNNQVLPGFFVINSKGVRYRMFAFLFEALLVSSLIGGGQTIIVRAQYNIEGTLSMKMYLLNEDALQYTTGDYTIKVYDENANLVDAFSDTFEEVAFVRYAGEPQPPPSRMSALAPAP